MTRGSGGTADPGMDRSGAAAAGRYFRRLAAETGSGGRKVKRKPPGWEIDPPDSFLFIYYGVRYEQGLCGSPLVFSCKEDKTEGCKSEHHGKANTAGEADAAGQPDGG